MAIPTFKPLVTMEEDQLIVRQSTSNQAITPDGNPDLFGTITNIGSAVTQWALGDNVFFKQSKATLIKLSGYTFYILNQKDVYFKEI